MASFKLQFYNIKKNVDNGQTEQEGSQTEQESSPKRSFSYSGAHLWNSLPEYVRNVKSIGQLKREINEWCNHRFPTRQSCETVNKVHCTHIFLTKIFICNFEHYLMILPSSNCMYVCMNKFKLLFLFVRFLWVAAWLESAYFHQELLGACKDIEHSKFFTVVSTNCSVNKQKALSKSLLY